jgi:putative glutamine amidotransferase
MPSKKPKIGVTLSEAENSDVNRWPLRKGFDYVKRQYYQAILRSGGIPILLANVEQRYAIMSFLESIDGLLVTGGPDLHPRHFNQRPHKKLSRTTEARDRFELQAIRMALRMNLPILGICRGHQVLNVAFGGTIHQDLSCIPSKKVVHADPRQTGKVFHRVKIEKGSRLHDIIGRTIIQTNSSHHQAINKLGEGLQASAFAPDGVIEAIEHPGFDLVLGVQWHPESIYRRMHCKRLFDAFVTEAARRS